jgi:hypothetical protein
MKTNSVGSILLLSAILLFAGCASTEITSYWQDPGYHKKPHKILVVALLKDVAIRQEVEDAFVHQLDDRGLEVISGTSAFPVHTPGNKSELQKYLRDHGYDAFLLVRVVAEKDLVANVPGTAPWPETDHTAPPPEGNVQRRIAMTEANLYDVTTQKLFWTANTRTSFDEVDHALITDYVTQIVGKMQQTGLVP